MLSKFLAKKDDKILSDIRFFSFWFYALVGVINYSCYLNDCGMTRAPYEDDSYYYDMAIDLANGILTSLRFEPYSFFLSAIIYPFKALFNYQVAHYELLPINWFFGSCIVVSTIKLANMICGFNRKKDYFIAAGLVIFNSCFIDGIAHLYRDALLNLLLINAFIYVYKNYNVRAFIASFFTGLLRGANGLISIAYLCLNKLIEKIRITKKQLVVFSCIGVGVVLLSYSTLGLDRFTRSFAGVDESSAMSISERLETFTNQENAEGGVIRLLRSNNPLAKAVAIPIYMISPIKVNEFRISHFYSIKTERWYVNRFRIESVWELLMLLFYVPLTIPLFLGIYYWVKDKSMKNIAVFVIFILTLSLVTLISMQSRHKMGFILFFPVLYGYYRRYASRAVRKMLPQMNLLYACLILIYNALSVL